MANLEVTGSEVWKTDKDPEGPSAAVLPFRVPDMNPGTAAD